MKQKKWLVSVMKNKPVQQLKDIDFFTTDTQAELVFELTDGGMNPTSATVTVYNKDDGSLVSEDHPVSNGMIRFPMYTRERNIAEHAGEWIAQVVFDQGGEKYTTRQVVFGVGGNVLDDNIPSLDIKENMNNLIAQLEQAVMDAKAKINEVDDALEQAEAERVANEAQRLLDETQRQANEQERQASESGRVSAESTRETQEETRQSQEATREDNESERIASETTRKENEWVRVEAEVERTTSETSRKDSEVTRQSAEDERKAGEDTRLTNESVREVAESTREDNEATRISNMEIVQGWINNPEQFDGKNIEYNWRGTELGVRLEGDVDYVYANLKGEAGAIENLEAHHIRTALGFMPKNYQAGDNIAITDDVISVTGQLGLTEEEVKRVKVDRASVADNADTVAGHTVAKDVPADANFNDTIVDITGKADQIDLDNLQSQLTELLGESVVSESGHMDVRIWQEKFEYWDGTEWIEIETGGGGPAIKVGNVSDLTANAKLGNKIDIAWKDPEDIVFEGATLAQWAGTQLRRKEGTYPIDETQGTLVVDSTARNQYSAGYEDVNLTEGTEYFYALFPYTEGGDFTVDPANRVSATAFNKYERTAPSAPTVKDIVLLEATVTGGSGSVVSLDQSNWFSSPHTFTGLTEGTTYTPYSKIEETAEYYESAVVAGSSFTAIAKGAQPAPSAPTISGLEFDRVTVAGVTGTEVRLDSGAWHDSPHTFTGLTEETSYTAYARMKETPTKLASPGSVGRAFVTPAEAFVYGVRLDTTDSNPETCLTYIGESAGFTPVNGTTNNLGSWAGFIEEVLGEYVTVNLATKQETQQIDRNDFTKLKGGGNAVLDGSKGDLMWKVPKLYWKFETVGTSTNIYLSDVKVDNNFVCLAHTKGSSERDFIYYGVSLGVEQSGKLRSLGSGIPTGGKNISQFRTVCEANGTDVHMLSHYPWLLYQIILVILGKNLDTQTQWGNNHSSNTQNVNTNISKGYLFGNASQGSGVNAFINDPWGNQWQWLDGFKYDSGNRIMVGTEKFNDNATGYESVGTYSEQGWAWVKETQLANKAGFSPKATGGGSSSTYYCDYGRSQSAHPFPVVGGSASDGAAAGAFAWHGTSASTSNSRLSARIFLYGN